MKISTYLAVLISAVDAFPHLMERNPSEPHVLPEMELHARQVSSSEGNCGPVACTTFDEEDQFVDVRPGSYHQYIKPGSGDIRGPCPGLNAAANHGFIPRNGVLTIAETIKGLSDAYGMGADIAAFLAAYAVVIGGDLVSETWSIGGPYNEGIFSILGGTFQGISYSHNKYEGDSSVCRGDAYPNKGDAHSLDISKFEYLYSLADSNGEYTMDIIRSLSIKNQWISQSTNPYYFVAPFSGLLVVPAAHHFVINFMSSHSADRPNGYLNKAHLKSFFGISGSDSNLVWNRGQEQIPQDWYRRPSSNPYGSVAALTDLLISAQIYPQSVKLGGNTGRPNSFVGVDLGILTGGTYTSANLLQGNNLGCFVIQTIQAALPNILESLLEDVFSALSFLDPYIDPILETLGCPSLAAYDQGLFNQYPGYSYNPTGPATNYKE